MKTTKITKFEDLPENWVEIIRGVAEQGGMNVHLQQALNISRDTYDKWMKEVPEFKEEIETTKEMSEIWWVEKAMNAIENGQSKMFNQHLWSFIVKNKFPYNWREKTEVDVTSQGEKINNAPIQIEILKKGE